MGITAGSREVPGRKGPWQETPISHNNNNNNNYYYYYLLLHYSVHFLIFNELAQLSKGQLQGQNKEVRKINKLQRVKKNTTTTTNNDNNNE